MTLRCTREDLAYTEASKKLESGPRWRSDAIMIKQGGTGFFA